MSDNGNDLPEIPFGNRDDANGMASKALQQWAEQFMLRWWKRNRQRKHRRCWIN